MLVQMSFNDVVESLDMYEGYALCAKCSSPVGPVSLEEIRGMMSGKYGDVLCFECEDFPPVAFGLMSNRKRIPLLRLFDVSSITELPLHACHLWANDRFDVTMQLAPTFGWCLWIKDPDERKWQLKRVKMGSVLAEKTREAFCLFPVE